ncbi:TAXI family TRAP transporter solute-binding subunit [Metapseudomonas lalkuanensis]|uniref:TAXI family TRAP transporter solute-binding subunit n=1 Tax=Metapseudomonas lalkuanensis TaxID=2604832 RepID=A0A5J6QNK5_9GAMM|nr:TAXI family TRAP transporter solute-binding subunit [Pseudomonas lalkuanensis]QEY62189.1 TAXI family TRAP transporter solute-binding subunit [Pseudomonas lalkuanensis]UCO99975.1 TAXI family TRAP transporter solute-binding subunit [Pseudomonas lalkuanensis]
MLRALLIALLALAVTACSRGPDQATLETEVQQRLKQAFGSSVLSLAELKRRGSARDANAPEGEKRLVIYFDSTLKVERDQDFGSWDSPGVASLISALGAGPRGMSGIRNEGNRQGDLLSAHGSLIYRETDSGWVAVVPQGFKAPPAPETIEPGVGQTREQLVAAIGTALNLAPGGTGTKERAIIADELSRSLNNIQGRLSRLQEGYPLAGGPAAGQYARLAQAMASLMRPKGLQLTPLTTEGGLDNLRMLRRGDVVVALSQSDMAQLAVSGSGPFTEVGPYTGLRALASLYPEPVHVLVRGDSPIHDLAGLRGKRVNLGQPGSASRDTAVAVLAAHGIGTADLAETTSLDLQQALTAIRDGKLDATLQVIGAPADSIRAASEAMQLRLLPLEELAIRQLETSRPGTFAAQVAAATYPNQTAPVPTIAVSALLLCDEQLSAGEAEQLVQQLFAPDNDWLAAGSIQGEQLSKANARRGLAITLHEGALKALEKP